MLIQQFRYDNYRLHQLGNNSVFTLTLQAGLSAIKTPYPSQWECSPCAPFLVRGWCADPAPYQPWSLLLKQRLQVSPRPRSCLDCVAAAVLRQCREGSLAQIGTIVLSSLHGVLRTLGPRPARPP